LCVSAAPQAAPRHVVLPTGSVIPVRLDQSLTSKTAQSGDRFVATVRYGTGDAGLPEGASVQGVVRESLRSAGGKPGVLDLDFRRLVTPGGQDRPLTGSLIALDSKSVQSSDTGRMVATGSKSKDRLKFIGLGAGAGLLIGTLTKKGNKVIDTMLGAGAGYLYNELKNKKAGDVNLKAGTEFGIRLDRQLAFDTNRTDSYRTSASDGSYDDLNNQEPDSKDSRDPLARRTSHRERTGAASDSFVTDIGMRIDDRSVSFGSTKPFMRGRKTLVPLGIVARAANFDYYYDSRHRMIRAGRNGDLRLGLNSRIADLNGAARSLPVVSEIRDGTLYVPAQFIGLATGGTITWDSRAREVVLTTDRGANDPMSIQ
jgi:hypothetical protein